MRKMLVLALVLGLVGVAAASDLGNQAPAKAPGVYPINVPNPVLQGGDTVANATVIPGLPYNDSGTTVGYNDDYSSSCYFAGGAPDVVYSIVVPAGVEGLHVALCGSTYDTGLSILNSALVEIACNDDFCGLQSEIEFVPVNAGETYYIIVDGYSSASGSYILDVELPPPPCVLECPAGGYAEGEPDLVNDYVDNYNGGCNTPPGFPFQPLTADENGDLILCGVSGWYLSAGSQYRDTDWYILSMGAGGSIEITADAEYATFFFELAPQICDQVAVAQQITAGPCAEAFMTISGYGSGSPVWFWAGPTVFAPPAGDNMYDYVVWFSGLEPGIVATQTTTWGNVKALYQ